MKAFLRVGLLVPTNVLLQRLEEREHIRRGPQEKVAKIVQCGEKIEEEAIRKGWLKFCDAIRYRRTFCSHGIFKSKGLYLRVVGNKIT